MKSGAFEMLDHESKAQFGEGQEHKKAYGSVYKYNMSRLVWQSLKSGEEQHKWGSNTFVRLRCRKNNLGPLFPDIGLMLTFRTKSNGTLDTITFTQADPAAWPAGDDATIEVRIVEHLRAEGPATIIDVAKAIGENPNSVKAKMMLLQKRGVVVQVGKDGGRAIYALKGSSNSNLS